MEDSFGIDENVIRRFKAGDTAAFETIYRHTAPQVYRFVLQRLPRGTKAEARDVVQDVFFQAWKGASGFRGGSAVETWLCGIARYLIHHRCRRKLVENSYKEILARTSHDLAMESKVDFSVLVQDIRSLAKRLPPKQLEAYELVHIGGLSMAAAANRCGCSIPILRARLRDARAQLRGWVDQPDENR